MEKQPLATVDNKTIYTTDLDALIKQLPQEQASQFTSKEGRRQLLEELIAQELFYLEGKKLKEISKNYLKTNWNGKLDSEIIYIEENKNNLNEDHFPNDLSSKVSIFFRHSCGKTILFRLRLS